MLWTRAFIQLKKEKAMNRKATVAVLLLGLFLIGLNASVWAGTSGKVTGVITDVSTKEPLPGANVIIEGTSLGAATDLNGRFIILNVRPGLFTVRTTMMGYREVRISDVRVRIDLTTTVDAQLTPTVLESGEAVTITAERALVQMDMTSSMAAVGSDEIENLPVQSVEDVLGIQAGVVRSGNDLHIRGGRSVEVTYWVDGVSITDAFRNDRGVTVENAAIQELQVISGTFNAEYGQAMSGIVNIITKEGSTRFMGDVSVYAGDYISGRDEFSLNKSVNVIQSATAGTQTIGQSENPLKLLNPIYNVEGTFSGPLPVLKDKLSFFFNGRYYSSEGYLYGRDWYTPQGNPGKNEFVPMNPYWRTTLQGKLTYRMNSNIKLNYSLFYNNWQSDRSFNKDYKYNPYGQPTYLGSGTTHLFTLNHLLTPKTFYELKLTRFYTEQQGYVYQNPLATVKYLVHIRPDTEQGLLADDLDLSNPEDADQFKQYKKDRRSYYYYIDPEGPQGYIHSDSSATPTSYSFHNDGMSMNRSDRSTAFWLGKFDITSQVTDVHQVKTGVEAQVYDLKLDSYTIRPAIVTGLAEEVKPFQPAVPDETSFYRQKYARDPRLITAYIQDKIEYKNIIMNIGMRYDYFDPNSVVPTDPEDPNIYGPFKNKHIYKGWVDPNHVLTPAEMDAYKAQFTEYTPDELRALMHKKVNATMQFSPRLGIAYPITDRGVIHFAYGHFFKIPEFFYLYDNPDFKLSKGGGYYVFGNAGLRPEKTVHYEIGLQQQLTDNIGVDVSLFYKDTRDWVGTSPLIDTPIPSIKYVRYENKDYENVRGVTVKTKKRFSDNWYGEVDYSFMVAEGTYSNPGDAYNDLLNEDEPRKSLIPMGWDQRHTFSAQFAYMISGWTLSMIGTYNTGRPYTPDFAKGEFVGSSSVIGLRENSARLPAVRNMDIMISRNFFFGRTRFQLFLNVFNVFDIKDVTGVYADTGSPEYTTNIDPDDIPYNVKRVSTVEDYVKQPSWYTAPRQVQLGFSVSL